MNLTSWELKLVFFILMGIAAAASGKAGLIMMAGILLAYTGIVTLSSNSGIIIIISVLLFFGAFIYSSKVK